MNKRPPPKGPNRPMLRTSHGAPSKTTSRNQTVAPDAASRPAKVRDRSSKTAAPRAAPAGAHRGIEQKATPGATSIASDESREMAITIAIEAIEKKASGLEVIDVAGRVDYADFLVLMSGRSDRHVTALSNAIEEALRKRNKRALAVEGLPHANWVLMDFGDVVVHVFQDDARSAYDIDSLWMDARRIPVPLSI
ncbi:MAG: ribosome silencing factor [Polyangiaceae bacterium]|nr:ribosome silencing factor [Polyangiaceae bacterium]